MKRTVAIDLDGTLRPHGSETAYPGAKDFMQRFRKQNCEIVIHSCACNDRRGLARVEQWLIANEIPYDYLWDQPGKPIASLYVDDCARRCSPGEDGPAAYAGVLAAFERDNMRGVFAAL